jgi:peptidoglycan-associated lipoprotein
LVFLFEVRVFTKESVMKIMFKYLALSFFISGLVACSSTSTEDSSSSTDGMDSSSSSASTSGVGAGSTSVSDDNMDPEAGLESVFYFEFDESTLTASTRAALDAYAAVLRSSPRNIRLEGHADERGTREYNIALGERRAKSVADYLIASGVSASRIETISYGEERPAVSASTPSAWAQNRRVELK